MLWIDLETTGLDPRVDDILEVAAGTADLTSPFTLDDRSREGLDPEPVRSWLTRFRWAPGSWRPEVQEMHRSSGLLKQHAESARDEVHYLGEVERLLLDVVPDPAGFSAALTPEGRRDEITILAGSSVHFDLAFIRNTMPTLASRLSHRVYDVSAVKLFCRSLGMDKISRKDAHRAAQDVLESIEHARICWAWLEKTHGGTPSMVYPF